MYLFLEVYEGLPSLDALEKWVEEVTARSIGEFNRRNEGKYLKAGKSLVYYFSTAESAREAYRTSLSPLAKKFKEYLSFVTVDANEYGHMMSILGLKEGKDGLAEFNPMYGQMFPFKGKVIDEGSVEAFMMDIVQGKLGPMEKVAEENKHTEL